MSDNITDIKSVDRLISKNKEEIDIFGLDTVSFVKKFDANTKDLCKRRIEPIAKRLHMDSIYIDPYSIKIPWYKHIQHTLLTIFLMPLRVMTTGLTVTMCSFLLKFCTIGEGLEKYYINNPKSEHYGKPVHRIPKAKWRRCIIDFLIKNASKFILFFGLGFYNVKIKDLRKKDKDGKVITSPLIIANHSTLVDVLVLMAYYDTVPSFLSMKWINTTPLVGGIADALQCIYVQNGKNTGLTDEIKSRVNESEKYDLPPFVIFPEGTTTNGTALVDFRYGAFYPHVPIQPIAIKYKYKYYNPSYVVDKGVEYIINTAKQFRNDLEITFLPVVNVETEEEKTDIQVWTEKNYEILAKELKVPLDRLCTRPQKMFYLDYIRGKIDFETAEKNINELYNKKIEIEKSKKH
ncbi:hypothetical protein BCR32DRAFT_272399 [Anaeromyces robustus]|uniref:Phospholipid/glycerol acyltransferase domain-containing protein n=1 Tax=Anaeromyces robustus TaxID=1754192 RepID=A0A1Y1WA04_9FUNG|nr:hypothetical protein BCR32DRAFT_272399 [Anaeromyces robustus]|eukprot:ORX70377.1 hypothetical protein BCR32DRAFT_272399 [Anaeromyces robustus]